MTPMHWSVVRYVAHGEKFHNGKRKIKFDWYNQWNLFFRIITATRTIIMKIDQLPCYHLVSINSVFVSYRYSIITIIHMRRIFFCFVWNLSILLKFDGEQREVHNSDNK
ncbi:unnamed protein product [Rotaria socialis]